MSFNLKFDPTAVPAAIRHSVIKKAPQGAIVEGAQKIKQAIVSQTASDAITSSAKAMINMQKTPEIHSGVLWKTGPEFDYMRERILSKAGVFTGEETPKELTKVIKAVSGKKTIFDSLKGLGIENFTTTTDGRGVRGACQLSPKNKKRLPAIKDGGIKRIIDLRMEGSPQKSAALCEKNGLSYFNFPVAYEQPWDEETIQKIPQLIQEMKKGDYYIGCAYGLHRTDTAIALSYIFDPNPTVVPKIESGVTKDKLLSIRANIFRALNNICYTDKAKTQFRLDDAFAQKCGWKNLEELMAEIPKRKQMLNVANGLA